MRLRALSLLLAMASGLASGALRADPDVVVLVERPAPLVQAARDRDAVEDDGGDGIGISRRERSRSERLAETTAKGHAVAGAAILDKETVELARACAINSRGTGWSQAGKEHHCRATQQR